MLGWESADRLASRRPYILIFQHIKSGSADEHGCCSRKESPFKSENVACAVGTYIIAQHRTNKLPKECADVNSHIKDCKGRVELAPLRFRVKAADHAGD